MFFSTLHIIPVILLVAFVLVAFVLITATVKILREYERAMAFNSRRIVVGQGPCPLANKRRGLMDALAAFRGSSAGAGSLEPVEATEAPLARLTTYALRHLANRIGGLE